MPAGKHESVKSASSVQYNRLRSQCGEPKHITCLYPVGLCYLPSEWMSKKRQDTHKDAGSV